MGEYWHWSYVNTSLGSVCTPHRCGPTARLKRAEYFAPRRLQEECFLSVITEISPCGRIKVSDRRIFILRFYLQFRLQNINRVWMELEVLRDLYTRNRSAAKIVGIELPGLPVKPQDLPVWLKNSYKWPKDVQEILKRLNDRPSIEPGQRYQWPVICQLPFPCIVWLRGVKRKQREWVKNFKLSALLLLMVFFFTKMECRKIPKYVKWDSVWSAAC